jgi:tetratricopeptide (TPR) repeat protein
MNTPNWMDVFNNSYDPMGLTSAAQNAQSNRQQIAQYAVAQAANYYSAGKNTQAIAAFKRATALDPNNTTANNYLGQIYMAQGDNANAIKSYQQLVRIQSNPATKDTSTNAPTLEAATISLANAYLQAKQYDQSEKQFLAAAKLNPKDPVPVYTLGQQYLSQGKNSQAMAMFQKTLKISPNDGNVYYAMGSAYNAEGKYSDAVTALKKSMLLKPNFPSSNYELGVAYNGLGDSQGVQQQLAILQGSNGDTSLASQLGAIIKPQMSNIDYTNTANTFLANAGPGTPLWAVDTASYTALAAKNSSVTVSAVIQFSSDMDISDITNVANWSISRGNTPGSGFYNYSMPVSGKEATVPATPVSVSYNAQTQEATVNFKLNQNSTGDATFDPSHLVFTFNGKDTAGQSMDQNANSIDGNATAGFGTINLFG